MTDTIDWESLKALMKAERVNPFIDTLEQVMQDPRKHFKVMQKGLQTYCISQVDPMDSLTFLVHCLQALLQDSVKSLEARSAAISHLLLELCGTITKDGLPRGSYSTSAASLCLDYIHAGVNANETDSAVRNTKLALKLAQVMGLTVADFHSQQTLLDHINHLVEQPATLPTAVGWLTHFQELSTDIDRPGLVKSLVAEGHEALAERWIGELGRDSQVLYVSECLQYGRIRTAAHAVRKFKLQAVYPEVEKQYKLHTLQKLLAREEWQIAATFAGQDRQLQVDVVRAMAMAGEFTLAEEYRVCFSLDKSEVEVDPEDVRKQEELEGAFYYKLPLPSSQVFFVSDESGLSVAADAIGRADVVGFDLEWKPRTDGRQQQPLASLLQVATRHAVFIIDLPALRDSPALHACLSSLFASHATLKLGFACAEDVRLLQRTCGGDLAGLLRPVRLLDLAACWGPYLMATAGIKVEGGRKFSIGLSTFAEAALGKPLNKAMQISNWEARPLSAKQAAYAALDAYVLLPIFDKVAAAGVNTAAHMRQPRGSPRKRSPSPGGSPGRGSDGPPAGPSSSQNGAGSNGAGPHEGSSSEDATGHAGSQAQEESNSAEGSSAEPVKHGASAESLKGSLPSGQEFAASSSASGVVPTLPASSNGASSEGTDTIEDGKGAHQLHLQNGRVANGAALASKGPAQPKAYGFCGMRPYVDEAAGPAQLRSDALLQCLRQHGLLHAFRRLPPGSGGIATAADGAARLGASVGQVAKSLAFCVAGGPPTVAVLRGDARLDARKALPAPRHPPLPHHCHPSAASAPLPCRAGGAPGLLAPRAAGRHARPVPRHLRPCARRAAAVWLCIAGASGAG